MKKTVLGAAATVLAAVLFSGEASSDESTAVSVRVLAFDVLTQRMLAQADGGPPIVLIHTPATVHLPAVVGPGVHPPDPCFVLATTWNTTVAVSDATATSSALTFEVLLGLMGTFACDASVVAGAPIAAGGPPTLASVAPLLP